MTIPGGLSGAFSFCCSLLTYESSNMAVGVSVKRGFLPRLTAMDWSAFIELTARASRKTQADSATHIEKEQFKQNKTLQTNLVQLREKIRAQFNSCKWLHAAR